jgi:hypothetical protein
VYQLKKSTESQNSFLNHSRTELFFAPLSLGLFLVERYSAYSMTISMASNDSV